MITSLRDIGYDFATAVADLVDNSIAAGAKHVSITTEYDGGSSWVRVSDDGHGMTPSILNEALRFGSRRQYGRRDLGRYGLGLKTASLSQCRRLLVATRSAPIRRRISSLVIDLDFIARTDAWSALDIPPHVQPVELVEPLQTSTGTVVMWAAPISSCKSRRRWSVRIALPYCAEKCAATRSAW